MAKKDLPHALTLERFASGKDGRANAFKKKKQANKRKLFEKAQLKRQYAKLLKKEAAAATAGGGEDAAGGEHATQSQAAPDASGEERAGSSSSPPSKRARKETTEEPKEARQRRRGRDNGLEKGGGESEGEQEAKNQGRPQGKPGKRRRAEHRPDPFKAAKATADQRRQEVAERQRERDAQVAEKAGRAKKRRKQHALLSKRTRGGQPVMKHTMKYLLEKIQSQER